MGAGNFSLCKRRRGDGGGGRRRISVRIGFPGDSGTAGGVALRDTIWGCCSSMGGPCRRGYLHRLRCRPSNDLLRLLPWHGLCRGPRPAGSIGGFPGCQSGSHRLRRALGKRGILRRRMQRRKSARWIGVPRLLNEGGWSQSGSVPGGFRVSRVLAARNYEVRVSRKPGEPASRECPLARSLQDYAAKKGVFSAGPR